MKKVLLIVLGLPILIWSLDKGDWEGKGFPVPILFFVPFILIYFFFPKLHKFARNIYLILTLSFLLLCIIVIKTVRNDGKPNYSGASSNTTATDAIDSWKTYTNSSLGITFKYPQNLDRPYC